MYRGPIPMDPQTTLSKNALKRRLKLERRLANAEQWKKDQKEKRKTKRLRRKESDIQPGEDRRPVISSDFEVVGSVALDMGFFESMSEKESKSLASQIMRCYALNRRYKNRFRLVLLDVNEERMKLLRDRLPEIDKWSIEISSEPLEDFSKLHSCMYLSADSEACLGDVSESVTYVIGGLVDHNRFKQACLNKATSLSLPTARLPIMENVRLQGSKVLTVTNVYEILLSYADCRDWKRALVSTIPKRKLASAATDE